MTKMGLHDSVDLLLNLIRLKRRRLWEEDELAKMAYKGREPKNDKWKQRYKEPIEVNSETLCGLPEGWRWVCLEHICSKITDGVHKKPKYVDSGIPFVTVRNLTAGPGISFEKLNYISESDHADFIRRTHPEKGDVLVSKDGTLGVVRLIDTDRVFSVFVSVALVKPVDDLYSEYLCEALKSPTVQTQMVHTGTGLQHIHLRDLRAVGIPLPPLNEQKRIVNKIESLTKLSGEIRESLEAMPPLLERLRQSVLAKAFRGDLTKEWRAKNSNVEPASKLLERVGGNLSQYSSGRRIRTYKLREDINYKKIPDSWLYVPIGNLADFQQGMQIAKNTRFQEPGENRLPILRTKNYTDKFTKDVHYVEIDNDSLIAEPNDIILARTGMPGKVLTGVRGVFHNNTFRLNFNKEAIHPEFLKYVLASPLVQDYIHFNAGNSLQADLTHKSFGPCPIALPPLSEQLEIAKRIKNTFQCADIVTNKFASLRLLLNQLNQSILAKAFRGELVPQDPKDEPASVLLERIKAEREVAAANSKKSKKKAPKKKATSKARKSPVTKVKSGQKPKESSTGTKPPPIEEMPAERIMAAFQQACSDSTWSSRELLIKEVSKILGYKRTGAKIKKALSKHLEDASKTGAITEMGS